MRHDVIVVGGSYAGMAAALQLARARRPVLVIDAGLRRNRFSGASHGFLSQDGQAPDAIAETCRTQLMAYPSVDWIHGQVESARGQDDSFSVTLSTGEERHARRLILATGVTDTLPDIPGLRERWGRSVFMCPYCDGYELEEAPLGVLASCDTAFHMAMLIADWGPTTLFVNNACTLDAEQEAALSRRGVTLETALVAAITGDRATVHLRDGRAIPVAGLFVAPRTEGSALATHLGCEMEESPTGSFITTDSKKETTQPGIFACGDVARASGSVSMAVGDGALAGISAHQSLIFR